jgi:hypothetical protein
MHDAHEFSYTDKSSLGMADIPTWQESSTIQALFSHSALHAGIQASGMQDTHEQKKKYIFGSYTNSPPSGGTDAPLSSSHNSHISDMWACEAHSQ